MESQANKFARARKLHLEQVFAHTWRVSAMGWDGAWSPTILVPRSITLRLGLGPILICQPTYLQTKGRMTISFFLRLIQRWIKRWTLGCERFLPPGRDLGTTFKKIPVMLWVNTYLHL